MIISSKELQAHVISDVVVSINGGGAAIVLLVGPKPNFVSTVQSPKGLYSMKGAFDLLVTEENFFGAIQVTNSLITSSTDSLHVKMSGTTRLITAQKAEAPTYCLVVPCHLGSPTSEAALPSIVSYADFKAREFYTRGDTWLQHAAAHMMTCGLKDSDAEVILLADSVTKGSTYRMSDIRIERSQLIMEI